MNTVQNIINTVKSSSPILYKIVLIHLLIALGCAIGLFLDDRTLMGINVWVKPLKFTISGAIYMFTFGYYITFYPFSERKKNIVNNINTWTLFVEILIIVVQAGRGVQSHYNMSSLLDGILFGIMGFLISINVMIMVYFVIETIRLRLTTSRSVQIALLMGWIIMVVGSWIGGQMISQMAHNVGIADGGEGIPILNWSTIAGDLRVAHFFGLHSIQLIPLFAVLVAKVWNTTNRNKMISVVLFGLIYAGLIGFTFFQAKQGLPFIQL